MADKKITNVVVISLAVIVGGILLYQVVKPKKQRQQTSPRQSNIPKDTGGVEDKYGYASV